MGINLLPLALSGALVVVTAASALSAISGANQEQTVLMNSAVTLSQAIAIAEKQTGGKAYDAGVDAGGGKPQIVVETNGPNGVQTVLIDAGNGQIVGNHAGGVAD